MNRIARSFTAATLALGLAIGGVTASATPARANNNDQVVAIIGGLIALYAIGQAIQNNNRNATPPRQSGHRPPQGHQPHQPHRPQALIAPARCFIEGQDRNGYYRGYVRRCMQNNVARPALLPDQCLRRVETYNGPRMIYAGRCLAQNGWQREAGFRP
jgi:hypothetical protein